MWPLAMDLDAWKRHDSALVGKMAPTESTRSSGTRRMVKQRSRGTSCMITRQPICKRSVMAVSMHYVLCSGGHSWIWTTTEYYGALWSRADCLTWREISSNDTIQYNSMQKTRARARRSYCILPTSRPATATKEIDERNGPHSFTEHWSMDPLALCTPEIHHRAQQLLRVVVQHPRASSASSVSYITCTLFRTCREMRQVPTSALHI